MKLHLFVFQAVLAVELIEEEQNQHKLRVYFLQFLAFKVGGISCSPPLRVVGEGLWGGGRLSEDSETSNMTGAARGLGSSIL